MTLKVVQIELREIRAVYAGKVTPNFKRDGLHLAPEDSCFSIVTETKTFDFEAMYKVERDAIVAGIEAILSKVRNSWLVSNCLQYWGPRWQESFYNFCICVQRLFTPAVHFVCNSSYVFVFIIFFYFEITACLWWLLRPLIFPSLQTFIYGTFAVRNSWI